MLFFDVFALGQHQAMVKLLGASLFKYQGELDPPLRLAIGHDLSDFRQALRPSSVWLSPLSLAL